MFTIKVPSSSANIGPGFDVIGLALSIYLELRVAVGEELLHHQRETINGSNTLTASTAAKAEALEPANVPSLNCTISYEGLGAEEVSLDPQRNLITRTALYVLKCHDIITFPSNTRLHIVNPIPLGRGLGSSGAAVVAGVALANELGKLNLNRNRMLDYCLMIERHPDNVAAALCGGFVGTYLNELDPADMARKEIPMSEVLPQPAGGVDTGLKPPSPPQNIGHYKKFRWAKEIQCIAIVPDFEVSTATARAVLPESYTRADMIFNMQRLALLATALGESPPDADMIYEGMQDKVHQPYRKGLIPGLTDILHSVTPKSHPGLLGICLSGAGPTILALATHNFDNIANTLINRFKAEGIAAEWRLLRPAEDGTTVSYSTASQASNLASTPTSGPAAEPGKPNSLTYASAGVSISAGNQLVQRIKAAVASTARPGTDAEIGGFGGPFDLHAAGYEQAPILIQAIDGVGTKLKIAAATGIHSTVGIDLVAMNVNDIVVQGAEPLSFLDYYGCGRLDVAVAAQFVEGVANGCKMAGCALVGGETAEMPGFYLDGEYDVAGQATGAVPRGRRLLPDKDGMIEGDVLLGLASSGPHSNGYSLIRKILVREGLTWEEEAPWEKNADTGKGTSVGNSLLTPTRIYVKACLALVRAGMAKGMAHITGGGLIENIPRMLPTHLSAHLDASTWPVPSVLRWLKNAGGLTDDEFARTWNTGLGMVIVVPSGRADEAANLLESEGEKVFRVGELVRRRGKRRSRGIDETVNEEEDNDGDGDGDEERRTKRRKLMKAMRADDDGDGEDGGCVLTNVHVWK